MKSNQHERNLRPIPKTDSIVDGIIDQLVHRHHMGKSKYGTDMDRQDLELSEWLQHSIEEKLDDVVYMQKILEGFKKLEESVKKMQIDFEDKIKKSFGFRDTE